MKQLQSTKKITLATVKAFARRNTENLFVKGLSSFDGMVDCVMPSKTGWIKVELEDAFGHSGVYPVGSSRDYFARYEDDNYIGVEVYNSCGSGILATPKK